MINDIEGKLNDIEGKLKEISHRFKSKQTTVNLTPQQRNLLKLKKVYKKIL